MTLPSRPLRVALADDQALVRAGLRALIERTGLEVAFEAEDGQDLRFDMEIDLEDALFGASKEIAIPLSKDCPTCHGSGAAAGTKRETCKQCGGTGAVISGGGFFN